MASKEFDFKEWFDKEVDKLEDDPEYIAYGEKVEVEFHKLNSCTESRRDHDE